MGYAPEDTENCAKLTEPTGCDAAVECYWTDGMHGNGTHDMHGNGTHDMYGNGTGYGMGGCSAYAPEDTENCAKLTEPTGCDAAVECYWTDGMHGNGTHD